MQDLEQGLHGALQLCDGAKTIIDANFLRFLERSFETRIQQSHRYQSNSKNSLLKLILCRLFRLFFNDTTVLDAQCNICWMSFLCDDC